MPRFAGQGSLFERLDPDAPPGRVQSRQTLAAERIRAIKQHLQWLLNARRGCSQSSPDLGLRDFNDASVGSTDLLLQVREDITKLIASFEPRVRVLDVRTRPSSDRPLDLHFRLDCLVPLLNREEQMEIDLVIHHQDQSAQVV